MRLSEIWAHDKQAVDNNSITSTPSGNANIQRQIQSMVPGQTIQGEVIGRAGGEVQIKLAADMVLNARLDKSIHLELGKNMIFQVMNNGRALTLSPLFANTATAANVYKAIDMAGLPLNEKTVAMTNELMEAGLPIDKNTLQQVYREINAYMTSPEDIHSIIELHRLELPVNETNVNQMTSYGNLTHQLLEGMNQIVDALPELVNQMLTEGNVEGAAKLLETLLSMDTSGNITESVFHLLQGEISADGGEALSGEGASHNAATANTGLAAEGAANADPATEGGQQKVFSADLAGRDAPLDAVGQAEHQSTGTKVMVENAAEPPRGEATATTLLNGNQGTQITAMPNQVTENMIKQLLQQLVDKGAHQGKAFSKALLEGLKNQWTLSPEQIAQEGKVEELYNRLDRQLQSLSKALEGTGQTETGAYKAVRNMSQNIDFMQQLNQVYTYVQLPIRLQQSEAHGDLYVYTNKKHLAVEDGSISALLHLDMEHLGPLDVYVAMEQQKVNTKFYVADESMLDFLGEHMGILTDRLKKRGYECDCTMQLHEIGNERKSGVEGLLQQEGQTPIALYAFDVRT